MNDHLDLYRQAKAAQRRAEQAGLPNTVAALGRIADMIAHEVNMDRGGVLPFTPYAAARSAGALPIGRQARP